MCRAKELQKNTPRNSEGGSGKGAGGRGKKTRKGKVGNAEQSYTTSRKVKPPTLHAEKKDLKKKKTTTAAEESWGAPVEAKAKRGRRRQAFR